MPVSAASSQSGHSDRFTVIGPPPGNAEYCDCPSRTSTVAECLPWVTMAFFQSTGTWVESVSGRFGSARAQPTTSTSQVPSQSRQ